MAGYCRTEDEIVEDLLDRAIPNGDCLECHLRPSVSSRGVERHYVSTGGRYGQKWRVTRLVWTEKKGPIPMGLSVLHTCDNPKCIKLEHLFLGTEADNTQDMMRKGRHKFILPNNQRVNPQEIRQLRQEGLTYNEIAEKLNVSIGTVNNYFTGPYRDR